MNGYPDFTAIRRHAGLGILAIAAAILFAGSAPEVMAADMDFMGSPVTPSPGRYLVESDVNVRDEPKTEGKRIGGLDAGAVVDVVGKVPGSVWMAVIKDGEPFGFVYGTVLSPIIDGAMEDDVTGEIKVGNDQRCGFRVRFIGKTEVEDSSARTADYDASIVCERGNTRIRFPAQMFMTEVPFDGSNKHQVFQVNIDLLDGVHALDDIFSTTLMFDLDKGEVRFDRVTEQSYWQDGGVLSLPATDVARALASALEIALTHWSQKAWDDIYKQAG